VFDNATVARHSGSVTSRSTLFHAVATLTLSALVACSGTNGNTAQARRSLDPECAPDSAGKVPYFSSRAFRKWYDEFPDAPRIYYSLFLTATAEPTMFCATSDVDQIRLTYLPGGGAPFVIRADDDGKQATVRWCQLEAPVFQLPPGEVSARNTTKVDRGDVQRIVAALETNGFWTMPTNLPPSGQNDPGIEWLVEARVKGRYHVVLRGNPRGEVRDLGRMLFRLTDHTEEELQPDAPGVKRRPYRRNGVIPGLPPPVEEPPPPPPPSS